MQKIALFGIVALTALALSTPLGAAGHCNGNVVDVGGTAYLDDRGGVPYIYVETNGITGLQTGGVNLFDYPDECQHFSPDLFVY